MYVLIYKFWYKIFHITSSSQVFVELVEEEVAVRLIVGLHSDILTNSRGFFFKEYPIYTI